MKINDYWRLAKISLKARKKATRSTISGMSISLIIIVPVIFAIIALYASILPQLNKNPEALYAVFTSAQEDFSIKGEIDFNNVNFLGSIYRSSSDFMYDRNDVIRKEVPNALHYVLMNKAKYDSGDDTSLYERIQIEDKKYPLYRNNSTIDPGFVLYTNLAVVDTNDLDLLANPNYGVMGSTYNKGFTGNGARQVILSHRYLKLAGLTANDVYGKKISIEMREMNGTCGLMMNGIETNFVDHYILRDFEVVGVIGSSETNGLSMSISNEIGDADIIVSGASYYGENGKPVITNTISQKTENGYNRYFCDFGNIAEKNDKAYSYIFPGADNYSPYNYAIINDNGIIYAMEKNFYKYVPNRDSLNPYGELSSIMSKMYQHYKADYESKLMFEVGSGIASPYYSNFVMINLIVTILLGIASVFAGIVLFAALVNLFNTIMHSVNSRKNYLGVMRAIGAKSSVIPKLYLFEVLRVFTLAFIWIAIIGGAICIGIKLLFDNMFAGGIALGMSEASSIVISISWGMIPITLLVVMALLFVIGFVYAIGCSWRISRKPIVEVLEG